MIVQRAVHSGMAAPLSALLAGLLLSVLGGAPAAALTAQTTLGDLLSSVAPDDRRMAAPMVARFVSDEGDAFVLDRSSSTPLLRFQDSQEILVLRPSMAARGDIIYRDEFGEPVLRQSKLGGVTLFAHERPGGAPVAVAGQAPALRLQALSPAALVQRMGLASLRASRAAHKLIVFDADEVTPGSEGVFADAAMVAAEALARMAERKDGRSVLSHLNRVLFTPGPQGDAHVSRGVLSITIAPPLGLAGRPSSARIVKAALQR